MSNHIALIRLSWPDKALSKNVGSPWGRGAQIARSKAVAAQRKEAWGLANEQSVKRIKCDRPKLTFTYHPPDRRRRDLHNMQEMLAGAIDGIQDALGQDDRNFDCVFPRDFSDPVKGGCVIIEVSQEKERIRWR